MTNLTPAFSHIYIEADLLSHPRARAILSRFPSAAVIPITHYKDVFNRRNQNIAAQNRAKKLILAKKPAPLLYPGAPVCQDFGNAHFYYTSCVMNCIFDCEYCYLKGMYPSGNLVIFLNLEEIFAETAALLSAHPAYVCLSYDTDLVALEALMAGGADTAGEGISPDGESFSAGGAPGTGFVTAWEAFAASHPDLTVEIRTKAAPPGFFDRRTPHKNVIYAFTLSPTEVIRRYEHGTPPLAPRLQLIKRAQEQGFPVRLCFDPMLHIQDWPARYAALIEETFSVLDPKRIRDASIGTFRIPQEYLKNMRRAFPESAVVQYPYETAGGVCSYSESVSKEMTDFLIEKLSAFLPKDILFTLA